MKFACPHCQTPLEADDSFAGAAVDCPTCGKQLTIPALPSDEPQQPATQLEQTLPPTTEPAPGAGEEQVPPAPEPVPEAAAPQEPATDATPPPPPAPKAAPKFRVVSKKGPVVHSKPLNFSMTPAAVLGTETPPPAPASPSRQPEAPAAPKAAPKFRVVSHSASTAPSTAVSPPNASVPAGNDSTGVSGAKVAAVLRDRFNTFTGLEKLEGFSITALFSEIFGKHKPEDIEEMFTVGTPRATPPIEAVDTSWPRPWLFFRALAGSVALYILFNVGWFYFENPNLIPGMMMMGTVAVPFSALLFFYEVNVRKNISLYQVLRLFFLGGILSLMISLVFFELVGNMEGSWAPSIAGPVEESGKLLALLVVARSARYHYKLNGLLMGAAIGTGFAVFESMGYALTNFLGGMNNRGVDPIEVMKDVIFVRGVLSPFGHIVWTAIAGAALWRVKGKAPFRFAMLANGKFWPLFLISVILHCLWNSPLLQNVPYFGRYLALGFLAWFVVIALVQEGLKELRAEKVAALENQAMDEVAVNPAANNGTN